jgi:hypothetical protein
MEVRLMSQLGNALTHSALSTRKFLTRHNTPMAPNQLLTKFQTCPSKLNISKQQRDFRKYKRPFKM